MVAKPANKVLDELDKTLVELKKLIKDLEEWIVGSGKQI